VHHDKAAEESIDLSRRVLGGIVKRAREGKWFGWVAPYGLRVNREFDPETGKVLNRQCVLGPEEEVRAVQFIFDAVANRGWSLRRVCRELEARAVKPPVGNGQGANKAEGRWNATALRKILLNRKYVGDLPYNETHAGKYSAWKAGKVEQHRNATEERHSSRNETEDVIIAPDLIPPLIDRDTFARAALVLERGRCQTRPHDTKGVPYLFTHLLVCGNCGSYLRGTPHRGQQAYICAKYKEYGKGACNRNMVKQDAVKDAILGVMLGEILSLERLDAIEAAIERQLSAEQKSGEAQRLRRQAAALERDIAQGNANLARLPEDRLPGVITQVRQWEGERAGLLARLDQLENGATEAKAVLAEARKQLWRLREALAGDDTEAQKW
jgi:hypothetical protein